MSVFNWETPTVSELEERGVLFVQDGNHGQYRPRPDEFSPEGTSFIRAADLADGRVNFDTADRINDVALERIRKGVGKPGDVLVSHKGTVGRVAIAPLDCEAFVCSPQTTFWRTLDTSVLDRRFLYALLRSPYMQSQFESLMNESDMAAYVSLTVQRTLNVLLPPIDEQRRIGGAIATLDEKIDHNRYLARLLDDLAEAIYQRSISPNGDQDGELPEGWTWTRVDEIAEINATSHSARTHPDEIEYIDISNTGTREIVATTRLNWADAPSRARRIVRSGDTLISTVRPERRSMVFVPASRDGLTASTGFAVISPVSAPASLIYRSVTSRASIDRLSALATGAAYPAVNPSLIGEWRLPLPPDRGESFDADVAPLERLRWELLEESRLLKALRAEILPKLFSRQLQVSSSYSAPAPLLSTGISEPAAAS